MKLSEDVGSIDISKLRLFANGRLYRVSAISYNDCEWFVSAENYINELNGKDGLYVCQDGDAGALGSVIEIYAEVDLRSDCKPENHVFLDKKGEHEVISITPISNNKWRIIFKDKNGSNFWHTQSNGETNGCGVLLRINRLKIYDEGKEIANPHDIQIHYEDMGDTIKLTDVVNMWSVVEMNRKFGIEWFDKYYRKSTPKVDLDGQTLYIYQGECDYCHAKATYFEIGDTYNKAEFLNGMEIVQEAARNLSRLRKEFKVIRKTITI
jgi:hypothetical protein